MCFLSLNQHLKCLEYHNPHTQSLCTFSLFNWFVFCPCLPLFPSLVIFIPPNLTLPYYHVSHSQAWIQTWQTMKMMMMMHCWYLEVLLIAIWQMRKCLVSHLILLTDFHFNFVYFSIFSKMILDQYCFSFLLFVRVCEFSLVFGI